MFIVAWCNKQMISDWIAVETREEAEKVYRDLKVTDDTWTVSISQVIKLIRPGQSGNGKLAGG